MTDLPLTKLPGVQERVESGPLQFGNDWPGIFLRGDEALMQANALAVVLACIPDEQWPQRSVVSGMIETLQSCHIENHPGSRS
jgi:hypothetical protein